MPTIEEEVLALKNRQKNLKLEEKAIQRDWWELQSRCPHPKTTYYPDASGNNGSWRECDICGADV